MRLAIPFVLLFAGLAPANDADVRCRQAKAALALAAAKGASVAPMPKEKAAAKPACSTCSSCECAQGFCPQACPTAAVKTASPARLTIGGAMYELRGDGVYWPAQAVGGCANGSCAAPGR